LGSESDPVGSCYVALAEWEGCELVPADEMLVRTLRPPLAFINSLAASVNFNDKSPHNIARI